MPVEQIKVISPVGGGIATKQNIAPRLDSLEGKTICEMWNGTYKGDYLFPAFRELMAKNYPRSKVIPYTEFPLCYGGDTPEQHREFAKQIAAMAREKGCDALITGNGA